MEAEKIYAHIASYPNGHFQLMINGRHFIFYYVPLQILLKRESAKTLLLTGVLLMDLGKCLCKSTTVLQGE